MTTPTKNVDHVEFFILSPEEIVKQSVCHVTDPRLYAASLPRENGLLDTRMGTTEARINCATCLHNIQKCVGHTGHIVLTQPVYHVYFADYVLRLLQCVCFFCSSFLIENATTDQRILKLIQRGKNVNARFATVCKLAKGKKKCFHCKSPQPEWRKEGLRIFRTWPENVEFFDDIQEAYAMQPFLPGVARDILQNINPIILELLHLEHPENMVLTVLLVPPPIIRPSISFASGSKAKGQDDLTRQLVEILKKNITLAGVLEEITSESKEFLDLQYAIANYFNNGSPGVPKSIQRSGAPTRDWTQRIKGKRGRIRNNLSAKRNDNSGRCVITPDSMLDVDQLGMPVFMALNLLFPERVNALNMLLLTQRVQRGPTHIDGARYVVDGDGNEFDLRNEGAIKSVLPLSVGWIVKRPLQSGDYVILNRNPSLHKKSIMAFRVKILPGHTLRLNLSVTTPLNADFDGDEVTVHAVSSYEARAELEGIMAVNRQLLNPQGNRAAMGLVQDALAAAFVLTGKDIFLDRETFMTMMMWVGMASDSIPDVPIPAILKPQALWTGKQLFSLTLPGRAVNLHQVVRNAEKKTTTPLDPQERWILVQHGELLTGRLCKATLGPVANGLVHVLAKDWGLDRATQFLSNAQRMLTNWFTHHYGFSVGLEDCVIPKTVHTKVKNIIQRAYRRIDEINDKAVEHHFSTPEVEGGVSSLLQKILDLAGRAAQASLSFQNAILVMTLAGSKGNVVNLSQITAAIGLQLMESKRVPLHPVTMRSLSYFPLNTNTAESRAFIGRNFYSGLTPIEMFFHAATGREGLVDSAVKTATVGYMNRRAMKATESVFVAYDNTLRNAQGYIVNFRYGGADSMDSEYLERVRLVGLEWDDAKIQDLFGAWPADQKRVHHWRDQVRQEKLIAYWPAGAELDPLVLLPVNLQRVLENYQSLEGAEEAAAGQDARPGSPREQWMERLLNLPFATTYWKMAVSVWLSWHYTRMFSGPRFAQICQAVETVYYRSMVQPGEAVGALCAQSIGEPTTQMTLNSFHHAGLSKSVVHMGMPRLLELWDCNTQHSSATIAVLPGGSPDAIVASLIYTRLEDVVARSELVYTGPPAIGPPSASHWVLDLYLKRHVLQGRKLSIRHIVAAFRELFRGEDNGYENVDGKVEDFTEPNDLVSPLKLRVRPNHLYVMAECTQDPIEANRVLLDDFRLKLCSEMELSGIPGIKDAWTRQLNKSVSGTQPGALETQRITIVETEGTDLRAIWNASPFIDFAQTYSNNIEEVVQVLGLEAGVLLLFHELRHIFVTEGTLIDERHFLTFISIMTFRGYCVPIRRHGLNLLDTGLLSKATFEKTMDAFREGCLFGEHDALQGPSENILFAQRMPLGTGMVQLLFPDPSLLPCTIKSRRLEIIQTSASSSFSSVAIPAQTYFVEPLLTPPFSFIGSGSGAAAGLATAAAAGLAPAVLAPAALLPKAPSWTLLFRPPSPDTTPLFQDRQPRKDRFFPPSPILHEPYRPEDPSFQRLSPPPPPEEYSPTYNNSPGYAPGGSPNYQPDPSLSPSYPGPAPPASSASPAYQPAPTSPAAYQAAPTSPAYYDLDKTPDYEGPQASPAPAAPDTSVEDLLNAIRQIDPRLLFGDSDAAT